MGASTSRRISDYFGALQINELDETNVDVKLEGKVAINYCIVMFQECFGIWLRKEREEAGPPNPEIKM